ncbi:MAG: hypothetical protein AAB672_01315 [Patescibacteria group bacterium]
MKLILIDGGPASGKNTLGELVVSKLKNFGEKAILLDLDFYVEGYNPKWIWDSSEQKEKDQLNARKNIVRDIEKYLLENFIVIVIGERFLTINDVEKFLFELKTKYPIYLYHLNTPFSLREKRLRERGPHSLIDLERDQEDRDKIVNWPGIIYENTHTPDIDASNLMSLIQDNKGRIFT